MTSQCEPTPFSKTFPKTKVRKSILTIELSAGLFDPNRLPVGPFPNGPKPPRGESSAGWNHAGFEYANAVSAPPRGTGQGERHRQGERESGR